MILKIKKRNSGNIRDWGVGGLVVSGQVDEEFYASEPFAYVVFEAAGAQWGGFGVEGHSFQAVFFGKVKGASVVVFLRYYGDAVKAVTFFGFDD